jgi:hypothetical protein
VLAEGGRVVRSAAIRNAPAAFLKGPFLDERTARTLRKALGVRAMPLQELVLDVLRRDGRVLASFGWPWVGEAFVESPLEQALTRGRVAVLQPLRLLSVPRPARAAFFLFSRSEARIDERRRLRFERTGLTLYSLVEPPAPQPPPPPLPRFAGRAQLLVLPGPVPIRLPAAFRDSR